MIGKVEPVSRQIRHRKIGLEASSVCQLRCHSCPNASKAILATVGSGLLRLSDFQKLLDENPWIAEIELSNYGEIFLNPELLEIVKHAFERKVALTADNGVNLNSVADGVLKGLVKFKFRRMTVSLDGATSETYRRYRINGDYDAVVKNIREINLLKKQYRSKFPILTWQFVVFGHNEHELPRARSLAHELQMHFQSKLSWDGAFSPVQNREAIRKELGAASREEYKERYGVDYSQGICNQLWERPQINWDGNVLGCCRNFWGVFGGNVFRDGLSVSLNSENLVYAREMLLGLQAARSDIPCATCEIYLGMKRDGKWLKRGVRRWFVASLPPTARRIVKRQVINRLRKLSISRLSGG
jgi:MoaA/NifB/PqqE/SkfB family radical SAM enzyme